MDLYWERKYLIDIRTGTHLCSARGGREVAVLVWREEELLSIGREARGVHGVDEESFEGKAGKNPNYIVSSHQLNH